MKGKVVILKSLTVFWICCSSTWAAPVESEKGKDEFVFLLPATGNGGLIVPGLSVNLEPPLPSVGAFRNSRDSYGNPVPPYTAIESGNRVQTPQGWNFEIPSYASGITEIRKPTNELLPPLAAGTVPVDALLTPAVIQPSIELLPPLKDDEIPGGKKDVATNEIPEKPEESTTAKPESDDNKDHEDKTLEEQPEDKKYPGVKYTGGFGGPPGILGDQKEKGYAIIEKEKREKEEAAPAATEKHNEEHTEAPSQFETSPPEEKTTETTPGSTPLPSLGFNSVFSSALPPVKLANTSQTKDESSEHERGSSHTEATSSATSEEISSTDNPTTQQPIQPFSVPTFSSPTSQQPTTAQPRLSFDAPQAQQPFPFILHPGVDLPNPPSPTFSPPLGDHPLSPFGSSTFQQSIQSFGSPKPQQSIPSFPTQSNLPQIPNQVQQPIPSFGFPKPQQTIPSFSAQSNLPQTPDQVQQPIPSFDSATSQQPIPSFAPQPNLPHSPNEPYQPISTFGSTATQQPISSFNFPPIAQFPTFSAPPSVPSIPERFDGSEPQQQPGLLPPPISTLIPTNPTPNVFGSAPVPIPVPQTKPELHSVGSNTNVPGKYTGGFGGAPGVLGNQAKPGYAVQPDGSIKDPDHAYKPPKPTASDITTSTTTTTTTKAPIIVTPVIKYDKYTGGFGGPPGILKPFDNKH